MLQMTKYFERLLLLLLASLLIVACNCKDTEYEVGQVWNYKTRLGEEKSTLTIVRIEENDKLGTIVCVYADSLKINSRDTLDFVHIEFMPFAKSAIDSSVTNLIGVSKPVPDYEYSYRYWKSGMKPGEWKICHVPVRDIIDEMEIAARKN